MKTLLSDLKGVEGIRIFQSDEGVIAGPGDSSLVLRIVPCISSATKDIILIPASVVHIGNRHQTDPCFMKSCETTVVPMQC